MSKSEWMNEHEWSVNQWIIFSILSFVLQTSKNIPQFFCYLLQFSLYFTKLKFKLNFFFQESLIQIKLPLRFSVEDFSKKKYLYLDIFCSLRRYKYAPRCFIRKFLITYSGLDGEGVNYHSYIIRHPDFSFLVCNGAILFPWRSFGEMKLIYNIYI